MSMTMAKKPEEVEKVVIQHFKGFLGDRVVRCVTGGAPTSPDVLEFLKK